MYFELTQQAACVKNQAAIDDVVRRLAAAKISQERFIMLDDPFECQLDPLFAVRMRLAKTYGGRFNGAWCKAAEILAIFGESFGLARFSRAHQPAMVKTAVICSPDMQQHIARAFAYHVRGNPNASLFTPDEMRVTIPNIYMSNIAVNANRQANVIACRYWTGAYQMGCVAEAANIATMFATDPVGLVYADVTPKYPGGYRVNPEYNNQENYAAMTTMFSAVAALCGLRTGGSFVLKMYTFFEEHTRALIMNIASRFERACLYKPVASRGFNSEIFLICANFMEVSPTDESFRHMMEDLNMVRCVPRPCIQGPNFDAIATELAERQIHAISHVNAARARRCTPEPTLRAYRAGCAYIEKEFCRLALQAV